MADLPVWKKRKKIIFFILLCVLLLVHCSTMKLVEDMKSYHSLIPIPHNINISRGFYTLRENPVICVSGPAFQVGEYLSCLLGRSTGFPFRVTTQIMDTPPDILLFLDPGFSSSGQEGYKLEIDQEGIRIIAQAPAGLFYGCQTLMQLFPREIYSSSIAGNILWKVPYTTIVDTPRFPWRGVMLDVARHFFPVRDIQRFIDVMAYHKLNRLHLHLSDDQGWRIQIQSRPHLTLHGGKSQVGDGPGGYYTQEDYAEIVSYAGERCITIIPEIDMPGHTNAALASYAELNKDRKAPDLYRGTEVGFSCFDIFNEEVYEFINDVIRELAALSPGRYIHIGGDEVKTISDDDYIYFINRVEEIVQSHGKQMIGWEEISKADLSPGAIVQYWHNKAYARKAAAQGVPIIVSIASKLYMDMKYNRSTPVGQDWAGLISVKDAYNWDPAVPGLGDLTITGIEAPLWTETVTTIDDIEYLAFPRLAGYAELGWSHEENLRWKDYKKRLAGHGMRLDVLGLNYYKSPHISWYK
jgi:hexosaminidase